MRLRLVRYLQRADPASRRLRAHSRPQASTTRRQSPDDEARRDHEATGRRSTMTAALEAPEQDVDAPTSRHSAHSDTRSATHLEVAPTARLCPSQLAICSGVAPSCLA